MLNLEKAKKSPNLFRRLTGISLQEFDELMAVLKKAYPDYERRRLSRRKVDENGFVHPSSFSQTQHTKPLSPTS